MPLQENPLDRVAAELADWADVISTRIADGIKGGFQAPGAAALSEHQKLEYYTAQMFGPDGQPNLEGRAKLMDRMGPEQFAEVYAEVTSAHPELKPPEAQPFVPGYRGPDGLPGSDIAPDGLPATGAQVTPATSTAVPMPNGPIAP